MPSDTTLWGIHAGRTGDAESLFLRHKVIAIGWAEVGDLSRLGSDREAFKVAVAERYSDMKPGAVPVSAGQLYRFVHEMNIGDIVLYPSKRDRKIHFGRVAGNYTHDPSIDPGYPNRRSVQWLKSVPRTDFTQGALYEIGSALSLFQVRNYADEFLSILEDTPRSKVDSEDDTVAIVAAEIEEATHDFVLKSLSRDLKGHPLADFVAHLLNIIGYRTRVSAPGTDEGIDIVAHRDELGLEPPIIKVQVKSTGGNVGDPEVSSFYGKVGGGEYGLFVTVGSFTPQASRFGRSKANLRLIDGSQLVDLILRHYEQLDPRYKGVLPLKRVYVPEAVPGQRE